MDHVYDDSQFHDVSFKEFEELLADNAEIEIPLDSFKDSIDDTYDGALHSVVYEYIKNADTFIDQGLYKNAFSLVNEIQKAVPQSLLDRVFKIYDICSEHGVLDASIFMADYFFERWEADDDVRSKSFIYLDRIHDAGYLPYFWKLGYCYLRGVGIPKNVEKAKKVLVEGLLFYGDDMCAGYLKELFTEIDDAYEEATVLFFDKSKDYNLQKAYELYFNVAIYEYWNRGYCLMRIADIFMGKNIYDDITPRKCFLLYRTAFRIGVWLWDAPEADTGFDEYEIYHKLGVMYFDGFGTKKDYYKAAYYMSRYDKISDEESAMIDKYIAEASEKAECLADSEENGEYYTDCFTQGDSEESLWDEDPEDAFLY